MRRSSTRPTHRSRLNPAAAIALSVLGASLATAPSGAAADAVPVDQIEAGQIVPVSLTAKGRLSQHSDQPSISDSGRQVAFRSSSNHLVDGETIRSWSTYVRDRTAAENALLDRRADGSAPFHGHSAYAPTVSGNGRFVAFLSQAPDLLDVQDRNRSYDVFLRDTVTGTTQLVSRDRRGNAGDGQSYLDQGGVSGNGRWVVFSSRSSDLVAGDDNGSTDVFLFDRVDGSIRALSRTPGGDLANGGSGSAAISDDGRFVTYATSATDVVEGDTNGKIDIVVLDRSTGITKMITAGTGGEPSDGDSGNPVVSADGGTVVFVSSATNLVPGGGVAEDNVYAYDAASGAITLVSRALDGEGSGGLVGSFARQAALSADGTVVAFVSDAGDIVAGDDNGEDDVFAFDLSTETTVLVSRTSTGAFPKGSSGSPSLSRDGRLVAFVSSATDIYPGAHGIDVYLTRLDH